MGVYIKSKSSSVLKPKLSVIPALVVGGLALGAGVTAVQALVKTKKETGGIKALPFAKNLAGQTFKNSAALLKTAANLLT